MITRTYVTVRSQKSNITTDRNHEPSDAWPNLLFDNNVAEIVCVEIRWWEPIISPVVPICLAALLTACNKRRAVLESVQACDS